MVRNLARALLGHKQMTPFDVARQVQQQERQRDREQAQRDQAKSGTGAHSVHQAVAGFNTESASILLEDLVGEHLQRANNYIGKVTDLSVVATYHVRRVS